MTTHTGGCHCGRVRFELEAPADLDSWEERAARLRLIVPQSDFRLLSGKDDLQTYRFNTGVAQHHFCRHCGIKSFYVPRSHPDSVSVNANCLDDGTVASTSITDFDGRHWEQNIDQLSQISD